MEPWLHICQASSLPPNHIPAQVKFNLPATSIKAMGAILFKSVLFVFLQAVIICFVYFNCIFLFQKDLKSVCLLLPSLLNYPTFENFIYVYEVSWSYSFLSYSLLCYLPSIYSDSSASCLFFSNPLNTSGAADIRTTGGIIH